jgi:hypothetical protein
VAAIVPIAGTESGMYAIENASHVPTWAFHNFGDNNTNNGASIGPETDLFRCKNYTSRFCTIEHIDRMIPFAATRVMKSYSLNGGATQAAVTRTAELKFAATTDRLPTQWSWSDGRTLKNPASKTNLTLFAVTGHGGWNEAYGMQEMWQWLYAQKRGAQPTLTFTSPVITPKTAGATSGATVTLSTKVVLKGAPIAQVVADLKNLGGSNVAPLTYDSVTGSYKLTHRLPTSGLALGVKGIAIVAVDTSGNRSVKHVTFTITQ